VRDVEIVVGDVTDPDAVQRALEGCDAVLHAASVFSFDPRVASLIERTNVRGTDVVLGL
jgi:dihydroflavonol-4-reductase